MTLFKLMGESEAYDYNLSAFTPKAYDRGGSSSLKTHLHVAVSMKSLTVLHLTRAHLSLHPKALVYDVYHQQEAHVEFIV